MTTEAAVLRKLVDQRNANGSKMTHAEMADAMNVPLSTFAAALGGRSPPRKKTVAKFAAYFGVTPEVIRGQAPVPNLIEHEPAAQPTKRAAKHTVRKRARANAKGAPVPVVPHLDDLREHFKAFEHLAIGLTASRSVREYVAKLVNILHEQAQATHKAT